MPRKKKHQQICICQLSKVKMISCICNTSLETTWSMKGNAISSEVELLNFAAEMKLHKQYTKSAKNIYATYAKAIIFRNHKWLLNCNSKKNKNVHFDEYQLIGFVEPPIVN